MTGTVTAGTDRPPDVAPFEYCFHVPHAPRAVGIARTSLRAVLTAHSIPELMDRAELLASELLTNAIIHAHSAAELRVTWARATLRVAVWDTSPNPPEPAKTPDDAEHGRGLQLLALLADRWDHSVRADLATPPMKVVWFEISRAHCAG